MKEKIIIVKTTKYCIINKFINNEGLHLIYCENRIVINNKFMKNENYNLKNRQIQIKMNEYDETPCDPFL